MKRRGLVSGSKIELREEVNQWVDMHMQRVHDLEGEWSPAIVKERQKGRKRKRGGRKRMQRVDGRRLDEQFCISLADTTAQQVKLVLVSRRPEGRFFVHQLYATTRKSFGLKPINHTEDISRVFSSLVDGDKSLRNFPVAVGAIVKSQQEVRGVDHRGLEVHPDFRGGGLAGLLGETFEAVVGPWEQDASDRFSTSNFLIKQGFEPVRLHLVGMFGLSIKIQLNSPELKNVAHCFLTSPQTQALCGSFEHNALIPFHVEFARVGRTKFEPQEHYYPEEVVSALLGYSEKMNKAVARMVRDTGGNSFEKDPMELQQLFELLRPYEQKGVFGVKKASSDQNLEDESVLPRKTGWFQGLKRRFSFGKKGT